MSGLEGIEREFPLVRESAYLNHAASAPLPRRSGTALRRYVDDREHLYHLYQAGAQDFDPTRLRTNLARLMNVPAESIALVPTTTDAIGGALEGIEWRAGDNVLFAANDFPGVVYPCLHLQRRGVEARSVPVAPHLELARLLDRIDRRTRAVVVSHVHWQSGHRIDLAALGAACRASRTLSVVDAMQSLGALPIDVRASDVDVLAAGSYKWLLGVPGVAALYVSRRALAEIVPDRAGWVGMQTSVHDRPVLAWATGARRYQVGGQTDGALIALDQSVELLLEVGVEAIARHVNRLLDRLLEGLPAGLEVVSSLEARDRSTILSVTTGGPAGDDRLTKALVAEGIIVARRGSGIRISPHLHNDERDIDRFVEAARRLAG